MAAQPPAGDPAGDPGGRCEKENGNKALQRLPLTWSNIRSHCIGNKPPFRNGLGGNRIEPAILGQKYQR